VVTEKKTEAKEDRKMALLNFFRGGGEATEKMTEKQQKRQKNSTIKPLSTISVPCMKI